MNTYFCTCVLFSLWYTDEDTGTHVCACGHSSSEHIDDTRTCLGEVMIVAATSGEIE